MVRRSGIIGKGIYQWEWLDDKIDVAKWNNPPSSTDQWVNICPDIGLTMAKYDKFYLEGASNEDIKVVPVTD